MLARFYTFNTASGHQISLTGLHLIPIVYSNNTIDYIPARNVQLGDRFYVRMNQQIESSPVINITIEIKQGYFAPLTMTGKDYFLFFSIQLMFIQLRNNISE